MRVKAMSESDFDWNRKINELENRLCGLGLFSAEDFEGLSFKKPEDYVGYLEQLLASYDPGVNYDENLDQSSQGEGGSVWPRHGSDSFA